ncbi:MAG TPA: tRNA preQ1(34) S-adenosylmethionine ribosyltransferase-isomerase QueA [Anaerolineae bacterium]|mgnify:CR=1 FL=1|nr:tRNA preQ1(34) S-adenosylmethionine ribosyltransferase-isomerase QueA [Anaerolineae bacterium]HQI84617.1 tRNA preQ1(34) S-adenosylmethionine ribosyltransferase-isomerase QueA [Anaerolineae bacterium]
MKTTDLDYTLPEELIAQTPVEPRDSSRLLVLHRDDGRLEHRVFRDIGEYLRPGDLLVANESRVIPARLFGHKEPGGGKVEVLLLRKIAGVTWRALVGGARTHIGTRLRLEQDGAPSDLTAKVLEMGERGERLLAFSEPVEDYFDVLGVMPLPPYIHEPLRDPERYQTVYAHTLGSAAAPTAGLHFTPELLLSLREQGVSLAFVTLHVGLDTFRPITEAVIEEHRIHTEWGSLSLPVAEQINRAKVMGGRVIAVGTTSVRVLETAARRGLLQTPDGASHGDVCPWRPLAPFEGFTDLYITPGFRFRAVDAMITNFHLPKSTLLALVMAFAGEDNIRRAYAEAIAQRYRFFSFGDATLIM